MKSATRPTDILPPPCAFGMPDKFSHWRPNQAEAVLNITDCDTRFLVQSQPTGSGKSLCYIAAAALSGRRALILTSTKALQSQLLDDFGGVGLEDIRGQNAYQCIAVSDDRVTCDHGPCKAGIPCRHREEKCLYRLAVERAKSSALVVTNYAYWMHNMDKLGRFGVIVMDEAHDAPNHLRDFLSVTFTRLEIEGMAGGVWPHTDERNREEWVVWAHKNLSLVQNMSGDLSVGLKDMAASGRSPAASLLREVRALKQLERKLQRIAAMEGTWVAELKGKDLTFGPVDPAPYAERCLFQAVKNVVLVSATVRPKTAELLGIRKEDMTFKEYDSTFPEDRRPVIHVPTVRMNHRTTDADMHRWLQRIDGIIRLRKERKGIIHTVSYKRRNFILQNSKFRDQMITHDIRTAGRVVREFKRTTRPVVLVSPSMVTGYDFPYRECEYQVISKLSFPDARSKVMQAITGADKDYVHYLTMQSLVQACGRGMRAADDMCECFIIDDNIQWFLWRYKNFAPVWFIRAFRKTAGIVPRAPGRPPDKGGYRYE